MSIYRKDEFGVIRKTASSLVKRWNDRIFLTTHTVENGADYYEIAAEASKYIVSLNDLTEYQLYINEPNETDRVFITFKGQQLELLISTEDDIIPGRIINNLHCYTLDMSTGYIWTDAPYTVIENYLLDAFSYLRGQNGGARQVSLFGESGNAVITYNDEDILVDYHGLQNKALKTLILEVQPFTGVVFTKGMSVMYAGSIGNTGKKTAKPTSLADLGLNPNLFLGVVTKVLPNNNAIVSWYGEIDGLNTAGLILGAPVFVGQSGTWTTSIPQLGAVKITIGTVEKVHATEGKISIRPDLGLQLKNLQDVYFTEESLINENDALVYSAELGYWRPVSRDTYLENVLNKDFTSLIEEVSLSLSDVFVVDKGSGARKVSLGTIASYLSTQELQLFTIVEELPNENQNPNTIYLLVTENEEGNNRLLEYIWIENQERWELIGSLEVDLSDYYTKTEANDLFNNKVDKNNAIVAGTKTKITYDAKGLVTSGADLEETDIPELPQSKITNLGTNLDSKVNKNADIVGATKTKITYDTKGLVTAGADLTAEDIPTHQHTKSEITDFPTIPANKSYSKTITTANWTDKKYAVTISGLEVSDTVLLSGADDIFTTNGLTATITANTLTFEVETLPTVSIDVNFTVIKTEGGTL